MQLLVHPNIHMMANPNVVCYFSKNQLKILRIKWWSCWFWWNSSFLHIFFFCKLHPLLMGKTPKPFMAGKKLCLKSRLYCFPCSFREVWAYFKFILLLSGDINLNPGPTAQKQMIYYGNFSFSTTAVFLLSGWIISVILYL